MGTVVYAVLYTSAPGHGAFGSKIQHAFIHSLSHAPERLNLSIESQSILQVSGGPLVRIDRLGSNPLKLGQSFQTRSMQPSP